MNDNRTRTAPSAASEGKANARRADDRKAVRDRAEIRARQRSLTNALLCCMI